MIKALCLFAGMLTCAITLVSAEENAQRVLEMVRAKYESLSDAEIKFTQTTIFELSKVKRTAQGTISLKKKNKYRVEFEDQTIVTNGETVWKYSASQQQVLIDHFKLDSRALTPERVLRGAGEDFLATALGTDRVGKSVTTLLKLVAASEDAFVRSMKLWVDESTWLIRKVEYIDAGGTRTEYTVHEVKVNPGLDDARFTYQVPEGVEVVDLR